jgi:hypothetical protein
MNRQKDLSILSNETLVYTCFDSLGLKYPGSAARMQFTEQEVRSEILKRCAVIEKLKWSNEPITEAELEQYVMEQKYEEGMKMLEAYPDEELQIEMNRLRASIEKRKWSSEKITEKEVYQYLLEERWKEMKTQQLIAKETPEESKKEVQYEFAKVCATIQKLKWSVEPLTQAEIDKFLKGDQNFLGFSFAKLCATIQKLKWSVEPLTQAEFERRLKLFRV